MKLSVNLFVAVFLLFVVSAWAHNSVQSSDINSTDKSCRCFGDECSCCEHIDWSHIGVNGTICTNVTYLSEDYGISITITYNTYTIFNETVSARNPPPICVGIPELEKIHAAACIRLYDLSFGDSHFHGCARGTISVYHMIHKSFEFGCWNIPASGVFVSIGYMNHSNYILQTIKKELEELSQLKNEIPAVNMI